MSMSYSESAATPTLDELLAAHAAGRLPPPVALVVASHLALSPESRRRHRAYEAVGGALLEAIEPAPLAPDAWDRLLARLDDADREPGREPSVRPRGPEVGLAPGAGPEVLGRLPRPLRDLLPDPPEGLPWRRLGGGAAAAAELDPGWPGHRTTLLRMRPGGAFPHHTHRGVELVLVLEGAFRDETGRYGRGDLQIADAAVEHGPVAEAGGECLCVRVLDAPLRRAGVLGRLLDPFRPL